MCKVLRAGLELRVADSGFCVAEWCIVRPRRILPMLHWTTCPVKQKVVTADTGLVRFGAADTFDVLRWLSDAISMPFHGE